MYLDQFKGKSILAWMSYNPIFQESINKICYVYPEFIIKDKTFSPIDPDEFPHHGAIEVKLQGTLTVDEILKRMGSLVKIRINNDPNLNVANNNIYNLKYHTDYGKNRSDIWLEPFPGGAYYQIVEIQDPIEDIKLAGSEIPLPDNPILMSNLMLRYGNKLYGPFDCDVKNNSVALSGLKQFDYTVGTYHSPNFQKDCMNIKDENNRIVLTIIHRASFLTPDHCDEQYDWISNTTLLNAFMENLRLKNAYTKDQVNHLKEIALQFLQDKTNTSFSEERCSRLKQLFSGQKLNALCAPEIIEFALQNEFCKPVIVKEVATNYLDHIQKELKDFKDIQNRQNDLQQEINKLTEIRDRLIESVDDLTQQADSLKTSNQQVSNQLKINQDKLNASAQLFEESQNQLSEHQTGSATSSVNTAALQGSSAATTAYTPNTLSSNPAASCNEIGEANKSAASIEADDPFVCKLELSGTTAQNTLLFNQAISHVPEETNSVTTAQSQTDPQKSGLNSTLEQNAEISQNVVLGQNTASSQNVALEQNSALSQNSDLETQPLATIPTFNVNSGLFNLAYSIKSLNQEHSSNETPKFNPARIASRSFDGKLPSEISRWLQPYIPYLSAIMNIVAEDPYNMLMEAHEDLSSSIPIILPSAQPISKDPEAAAKSLAIFAKSMGVVNDGNRHGFRTDPKSKHNKKTAKRNRKKAAAEQNAEQQNLAQNANSSTLDTSSTSESIDKNASSTAVETGSSVQESLAQVLATPNTTDGNNVATESSSNNIQPELASSSITADNDGANTAESNHAEQTTTNNAQEKLDGAVNKENQTYDGQPLLLPRPNHRASRQEVNDFYENMVKEAMENFKRNPDLIKGMDMLSLSISLMQAVAFKMRKSSGLNPSNPLSNSAHLFSMFGDYGAESMLFMRQSNAQLKYELNKRDKELQSTKDQLSNLQNKLQATTDNLNELLEKNTVWVEMQELQTNLENAKQNYERIMQQTREQKAQYDAVVKDFKLKRQENEILQQQCESVLAEFGDKARQTAHILNSKLLEKVLQSMDDNETIEKVTFDPSLLHPQMESQEIIEQVVNYFNKAHRHCTHNEIANYLICLTQGFITTFAGEPGTGKTSLCTLLANALGLSRSDQQNRFIEVAVERGWTSSKDFIGYYNPLTKTIEKSNEEVFNAFVTLDDECQTLNLMQNDIEQSSAAAMYAPYFILLDEANLSPIEHYWATFLKNCELVSSRREISLGSKCNFKLPEHLRFMATVNFDHTTEELSPRFLDRSWIIMLAPHQITPDEMEVPPLGADKMVSFASLKQAFSAKSSDTLDEAVANKWEALQNIFTSDEVNMPIMPRSLKMVHNYCAVACQCMEHDNQATRLAPLDYAFSQKILPLINGTGSNYQRMMELLLNECTEQNMPLSARHLQRIKRAAEHNMGFYQFFAR